MGPVTTSLFEFGSSFDLELAKASHPRGRLTLSSHSVVHRRTGHIDSTDHRDPLVLLAQFQDPLRKSAVSIEYRNSSRSHERTSCTEIALVSLAESPRLSCKTCNASTRASPESRSH